MRSNMDMDIIPSRNVCSFGVIAIVDRRIEHFHVAAALETRIIAGKAEEELVTRSRIGIAPEVRAVHRTLKSTEECWQTEIKTQMEIGA